MILRLAVKRVEKKGVTRISSGGILEFTSVAVQKANVHIYTSRLEGLILQEPGQEKVWFYPAGSPIRLELGGSGYCRWHTAPLDTPDDPRERRYCTRHAVSKLGYCRSHLDSIRAMYDMCLGSGGVQSLSFCHKLEMMAPSVKMSVYLTALEAGKYKVGVTRDWRLLDRLSEQPHLAAAQLKTGLTPSQARTIELNLSTKYRFTQLSRRDNLHHYLSYQWKNVIPGLTTMIKQLTGSHPDQIYRIEPEDPNRWLKARRLREPGVYRPVSYWAGIILLEDDTGDYHMIEARKLAHMDTVYTVG